MKFSNNKSRITSSFPFLDSREYIHSTSFLEFFESLSRENALDESTIIDAKFNKLIKKNGILEIYASPQQFPSSEPSATFKISTANNTHFILFFEDAHAVVLNREATDYRVLHLEPISAFEANAVIDGHSPQAIIRNIVEANKKIHLDSLSFNKKPQVLNLYMQRFPLCALRGIARPELRVKIKNLNFRKKVNSVYTLNEIEIEKLSTKFKIAYSVVGDVDVKS